MRRWSCVLVLAACGGDDATTPPDGGIDAAVDASVGTPSIDGTPVSSFEMTSCATSVVLPLSVQIAQEVDCLMPGQLVPFMESDTITFTGSAVLPYLSEAGGSDLVAAAAAGAGKVVQVTSAFRTVVQQYLLYTWYQLGRCGITAAAVPGNSNHESGRALDVSNYTQWTTTFADHGWAHDVPGDPVHYDHTSSPDIRGADILAFQRLWNRNAPATDQIGEDGVYGAMTEAAVKRAPAEGFGIGAICGAARLALPVHHVTNSRDLSDRSLECAD